jgi:hypothetical protein
MSVTFNAFREDSEGTKRIVRVSPIDDDEIGMNLANDNARSFLGFLGIDAGEYLDGIVDMPTAKRAIIRARATFEQRVDRYSRPEEKSGHVVIDGVPQLHIPRVVIGGISADYFGRRLDMFVALVEGADKLGATHIGWG